MGVAPVPGPSCEANVGSPYTWVVGLECSRTLVTPICAWAAENSDSVGPSEGEGCLFIGFPGPLQPGDSGHEHQSSLCCVKCVPHTESGSLTLPA